MAEKAGFRPPVKSRPDALARAVAGVFPVEGDPIKRPSVYGIGALMERQRIRSEVEHGTDGLLGSGFCCGGTGYVRDTNGRTYEYRDYVERQHRAAYALLDYGYDIRSVAMKCHLTPRRSCRNPKTFQPLSAGRQSRVTRANRQALPKLWR